MSNPQLRFSRVTKLLRLVVRLLLAIFQIPRATGNRSGAKRGPFKPVTLAPTTQDGIPPSSATQDRADTGPRPRRRGMGGWGEWPAKQLDVSSPPLGSIPEDSRGLGGTEHGVVSDEESTRYARSHTQSLS